MKFLIAALFSFITSVAGTGAATTLSLAFVTTTVKRPTSYCCDTLSGKPKTRFEHFKLKWKGIQVDHLDNGDDHLGIGFTYQEFGDAVAQTDYSFKRNDIVPGKVVEYDIGGCMVDIGAKAPAFLPIKEAALIQEPGSTIESLIELDTKMDFQIISNEDEHGQLLVSVRRIQYREAWQRLLKRKERDEIFEAKCIAVNRGGAIFLFEGLRAFLPGSHLNGHELNDELIGETLPLKFLQVNQEQNKLVVSHRRAITEQQMACLSRGDIVEGIVSILTEYGAFIRVGRMSGLLHISQMSSDLIKNLEEVIQPGQTIKCMIIEVDGLNGRIALSTKTIEPEPGMMLTNPQKVFDMAEITGKNYLERMELKKTEREQKELKRKEEEKKELNETNILERMMEKNCDMDVGVVDEVKNDFFGSNLISPCKQESDVNINLVMSESEHVTQSKHE